MISPFQKTIRFLAKSNHPTVLSVLTAALDRSLPPLLFEQVVATLLEQNNKSVYEKFITDFKTYDDPVKQLIVRESYLLSSTLQKCLKSGNVELKKNCLNFICFAEMFNELPAILQQMLKPNPSLEQTFVESFSDLINRLSNQQQQNKNNLALVNSIKKIQQALDDACQNYSSLKNKDTVLKSILILGTPEQPIIRNILLENETERCTRMKGLLQKSKHPGVMQFLVDTFSANVPTTLLKEILRTRDDQNFIIHLLRWVPISPTSIQVGNLKQVQSLNWLTPKSNHLNTIPYELQAPLARLISFLGLPAKMKRALQEWVIRNGSPDAKRIAADVLSNMEPDKVQQIVQDGLESDDEEVQAWSVSQLRSQNIPDAMRTLIDQLENDSGVVRDAARNELQGFNLDYVITHIDKISASVCQKVGLLLRKIDPDLVQRLESELTHPIYHRRLLALRAVAPLGMSDLVEPLLINFLDDDEVLIRRLAVESLTLNPSEETLTTLSEMRNDPNPRIREIIEEKINYLLLQTALQ